jgi:hypothetical protein
MAKLYITEFASQDYDVRGGLMPVALAPSVADQTLAIGVASVVSAAFNAATGFVRVTTDVTCSLKFGAAPVATANTMRLAADAVEYIGVSPGDKVAVITNT